MTPSGVFTIAGSWSRTQNALLNETNSDGLRVNNDRAHDAAWTRRTVFNQSELAVSLLDRMTTSYKPVGAQILLLLDIAQGWMVHFRRISPMVNVKLLHRQNLPNDGAELV